jgi:hypothetical protein
MIKYFPATDFSITMFMCIIFVNTLCSLVFQPTITNTLLLLMMTYIAVAMVRSVVL